MKASTIESVFRTRTSPPGTSSSRVLVLGGDVTGFHLAERLAGEGHAVTLLGPNGMADVSEGITVLPDTFLEELRGHVGSFEAVLRNSKGRTVETVGFVVAAQPAEFVPKFSEYRLTGSERILALSDFETCLRKESKPLEKRGEWFHAAFLLGLEGGSDPASLSRVLSAIEALQETDKVQSYVFTRDLKVAASGLESRYRVCRENGTLFFKFDEAGPTFEDGPDGPVMVFTDPLLGQEMELCPDLLVVDEHVGPPASLEPLMEAIPLSCMSAPFLQPDSTRFTGAETPKAGILAIGPARGIFDPGMVDSEVEAVVVALREQNHEARHEALPGPPEVDPAKCTMCLTCVRLCPHGAMSFRNVAEADPATCVRCGICAAECPMTALALGPAVYERTSVFDQGGVHDGEAWRGDGLPSKPRRNGALLIDQPPRRSHGVLNSAEDSHDSLCPAPGHGGTYDTDMDSRIRTGLAAARGSKKILGFLCSRSADQALEAAGAASLENLIPIVAPCAGTIDVSHMIAAFQYGADAVITAGCFTGNCASGYGTVLAAERTARTREIVSQAGMDPDRVRFVPTAGNTPGALVTAVHELEATIDGTALDDDVA